MKVLFASGNKGKQREAQTLLKDLDVELAFPADFPELKGFDVDETGETFIENAILKARAYAEIVNIPCIADDSGVVIDGMDGLPGIHSNRWFKGSSDDRNNEVLRRLESSDSRTARYITAACYFDPSTEEYAVFEDSFEGNIGTEIIGEHGFDYDRIMIPVGETKTFAQLGDEYKNERSQRAKAYKQIVNHLTNKIDKE